MPADTVLSPFSLRSTYESENTKQWSGPNNNTASIANNSMAIEMKKPSDEYISIYTYMSYNISVCIGTHTGTCENAWRFLSIRLQCFVLCAPFVVWHPMVIVTFPRCDDYDDDVDCARRWCTLLSLPLFFAVWCNQTENRKLKLLFFVCVDESGSHFFCWWFSTNKFVESFRLVQFSLLFILPFVIAAFLCISNIAVVRTYEIWV